MHLRKNTTSKDYSVGLFQEGVRLAEIGEWKTMIEKLEYDPSLATQKDQYGMLPLHWACTEEDVSTTVIKRLLKVYPEAALMKNNAQMLPLHVAVRANAPATSLRVLCKAYPSGIMTKTRSDKRPLQLAKEFGADEDSIAVLQAAEKSFRDNHREPVDEFKITKDAIEKQSKDLRASITRRSSGNASTRSTETSSLESMTSATYRESTSASEKNHSITEKSNNEEHSSNNEGVDTEAFVPSKDDDRKVSSVEGKDNEDPSSYEALVRRVANLEAAKAEVDEQLREQTKMHADAMLLLTETMTRVAELEGRFSVGGIGGVEFDTDASSEVDPIDFESPFEQDFEAFTQLPPLTPPSNKK